MAIVASYVEEDIGSLETDELQEHIDRTRDFFEKTAYRTSGVLTFYYRIDPEVSDTVKGFWYTRLDSDVFTEHEVTDISQYDTGDTSGLVWFTVPKATGEPIWLPPYITENLGVRVISYNVPIFSKEQFTGVVGIEVDYSTMAEEVDNIRLFDNGYAFIINEEGSIIYHPLIDVTAMSEEEKPRMPVELPEQNSSFTYTFEGVEKTAVWRPLQNGMRLVVSVPTSEISGSWQNLIRQIIGASVILLILFVILTMRFTGSITKPLRDLTDVAVKMNKENYDVSLDYRGDDEVGILTEAFNRLVNYLKAYIRDLNNLAYSDALTSVKSKGAYDIYAGNLQNRIQESPEEVKFAIAVFDCDNLKEINDVYGHEKGMCI